MSSNANWMADYQSLVKSPVVPEASPEAITLLSLLYSIKGKGILSGQHEYLEAPNTYSTYIYNLTGVYPSIKGVEFGAISGQTDSTAASQRQNVVNACISYANSGGIITATYHMPYPGMSYDWANVQRATTPEEFGQIITPGNSLYDAFITEIDKVAEYLKQLRDNNIPVLWRPFHEMNGGWFWWGQKTNFTALWEIMFSRYTYYHGLNNLLWVWSANANNQWAPNPESYYVGIDRCDILGMDIYDNDFNVNYYETLRSIANGKPFAITENGELPSMFKLRTRQPEYAWFLTWGNYLTNNKPNTSTRYNTDATIQAVYADPFCLNRGESYDPNVIYPADTTTGDGIWGIYYVGQNFNTFNQQKSVPKVDFTWTSSTTVGNWNMSVRWGGYVKARYTEIYTFFTNCSDGVRLYIDNQLIIDDWNTHSVQEKSGTFAMEAGKYYHIKLEYFNAGDTTAKAQLLWSSPSQSKEVIPQSQLYIS